MNALIEMAKRGYGVYTSSDGQIGPFTDGNGDNRVGVRAFKAANGAGAEIKVRNVYGSSEETGFSGSNMVLLAGEIELVTCYQFEVVSGTVRAYFDTNPPV